MLVWCWATVCDAGRTLDQHWVKDSCLLAIWHNSYQPIRKLNLLSSRPANTRHRYNVGLPSATLAQHYDNIVLTGYPANTRHWDSVGLLLGQRRRRWTNIKPTLAQCIVLAGYSGRLWLCDVVHSSTESPGAMWKKVGVLPWAIY